MDPKKLENRLFEWSRELGFTLPDGTLPQSSFFSQLVSTPNTVHLWEKILSKVEPRDRVQKVRKQILVAKLKSDEKRESQQDPVLNVNSAGIQRKIELWKRKKTLEKMIVDRRKEVDRLRDDVHKKARLIQSESCKLAEIEKHHSDLKEKLLISNLLMDQHKDNVGSCEEQIAKIKSFRRDNAFDCVNGIEKQKIHENVKSLERRMAEELDKNGFRTGDRTDADEIDELISDKKSAAMMWDVLLDVKMNNLKEYSATVDECRSEDCRDGSFSDENAWKSLKEKFMMEITENSLGAVLNRRLEKAGNSKLKEIITNIEKLMFNKSIASSSQVEISYILPNETGDSLTGRRENMSKFAKALSIHGLKKRKEFLKREIEKMAAENGKNEHWTTEKEKFKSEELRTSEMLESAKGEATELIRVDKLSVEEVVQGEKELSAVVRDVKKDLQERKVVESLAALVAEMRSGSENEMDLVAEMCLDAFRRIQVSSGKEVYEYESLQHCLHHYSGELREFFSTLLLSPYEKPETILTQLEERNAFMSYIKELITKLENDMKNIQDRSPEGTRSIANMETIQKNHKETVRVLSKVITGLENLETELDLVRNILKSWLKQPYRLMIPDEITVNSMTLRQFEEKYRTVQSEIKYCTELKQSVAYK